MNLDLLLSFVQAPQKMADHPVSDLEGMVAEYPYFSAAQMLLLKQYKLQNSSKFNKQLRHAAGVLPDRKQLYRLIEIWPEEVEQALVADAEVEVVPVPAPKAEEPSATVETPPVLTERKELAAPLSEVPLAQLEEVQTFGKEAAAEVPEETVAEDLESITAAEEKEVAEANASEVLSPEPVLTAMADEPAAVSATEDAVSTAEEEVIEEVVTSLVQEVEETEIDAPEAVATESESATAAEEVTIAAEKAMEPPVQAEAQPQSVEVTPPVEEWPVPAKQEDTDAKPELVELEEEPAPAPLVQEASSEVAAVSAKMPEPAAMDVPPAISASKPTAPIAATATMEDVEVAEFIAKPHDRLSWFKFFAGKPLREQSDEVLDQLYQEHMQQDLLKAPEQDQQISAIRVQVNRDEEVPSSKALEEEIRRLAYESISDDELPASETLAGIYAAQHDYKKAIRIYQKLILKFPDKMSYFARLIEELRAKS
jgi:hypothetical protein